MKNKKRSDRIRRGIAILVLVSMLAGCATTPIPPTQPPAATSTTAPSATPAEPTPTVPPTETPLPPTVEPSSTPTEPPPVPTETPAPEPVPTPAKVAQAGRFAPYRPVSVDLPARYQGYALPLAPDQLANRDDFAFSPAQEALLAGNGFVVAPAAYKEFFHLYEEARYRELPLFVTTDSVLHVYHLLFDKLLRTAEVEYFVPTTVRLSQAMLEASLAQYQALRGTAAETAAWCNVGYFAVALSLLEPDFTPPPPVADVVAQELALIDAHQGFDISPLFDRPDTPLEEKYREDYSQYVPRGHYTRSEALERYFRAMMWFGRINLRLKNREETRSALLMVQALRTAQVDGEPALATWEKVYEPTTFFVGQTDDLNVYDYGQLVDKIYGPAPSPDAFADEARLDDFIERARALPPSKINSMWVWIWEDQQEATQGFRFMGQRFVVDAYVFQLLIWRRVGTMSNPRLLPKGLDIFAALDSREAYAILDEMGETAWRHYPEQMEKARQEIAAIDEETWTSNLYWAWLYAFKPLIAPKGEAYPAFMQNQAWTRKDLHTALGSWAELKHDTLLYAKQVYAEMGGGPPPLPPKGYVEPQPQVYARLLALTRMTLEGLGDRNLLADRDRESLLRLENLLSFLKDVAEKELAGQPLDQEAYERIRYYGGELEFLTLAAADLEGESHQSILEQEEAAVIADVATGLDPITGEGAVLEEGVGRVFEIYVAVEIEGTIQIVKGGVFSYYEFPWPQGDRLTDEQWREMLETDQAPEQPGWTGSFIAK